MVEIRTAADDYEEFRRRRRPSPRRNGLHCILQNKCSLFYDGYQKSFLSVVAPLGYIRGAHPFCRPIYR